MPDLSARLMAVLFAAADPVEPAELAGACQVGSAAVDAALAELSERLAAEGVLHLTLHDGRYVLATTPAVAPDIQRLLGRQGRADLSRAALETLAIIAYNGPVGQSEIEHVRGVSSEAMIKNLIGRGLVTEAPRAHQPGQARRFVVAADFLHLLGLSSIDELPPLPAAANPGPGHEA